MSMGGNATALSPTCASTQDGFYQVICAAVNAGITVVVAAGNEETDLAKKNPAQLPVVLTVTAMADLDGVPGGWVCGWLVAWVAGWPGAWLAGWVRGCVG